MLEIVDGVKFVVGMMLAVAPVALLLAIVAGIVRWMDER